MASSPHPPSSTLTSFPALAAAMTRTTHTIYPSKAPRLTPSPEPRSRSMPASHEPWASQLFLGLPQQHTNKCLFSSLRKSRSHQTFQQQENVIYIDESELYSPPRLPDIEADQEEEPATEPKHDLQYKIARAQLRVGFAVHRAKKAALRKVGLSLD